MSYEDMKRGIGPGFVPPKNFYILKYHEAGSAVKASEVYQSRDVAHERYADLQTVLKYRANWMKLLFIRVSPGSPDTIEQELTLHNGQWYGSWRIFLALRYAHYQDNTRAEW